MTAHQHVPGMRRRQRVANAVAVAQREIDGEAADQFETRGRAIAALLDEVEEIDCGLRRWHADERRLDGLRRRKQLEHRRRDDAERAFGADEQVAQVVAGVVLLELVEGPQHASVGQHHFEAEHEIARDPIGKRAVPPALVERLPPMVQLPSAPSDSGNRRSTAAAASCAVASTTPASHVMVLERGSTSRMRSSWRNVTRTSPSCGIWPPTRPVLPPWGTIAVAVSLARRRMAATSSTVPGRSTTGVRPR